MAVQPMAVQPEAVQPVATQPVAVQHIGISSAIYIPEIALGSAGQRCPALPSGAAQRWAALASASIRYSDFKAALISAFLTAGQRSIAAAWAALGSAGQRWAALPVPVALGSATSAAQRCPAPLAPLALPSTAQRH